MSSGFFDELIESYDLQSVGFNSLRPHSVRDVLLVASLYDSYTLAEDGRLAEQILGEFHKFSLSAPTNLTRVSTAERALEVLRERSFDLVLTMARVGDVSVQDFGEQVKKMHPGLPVHLLTYDTRELGLLVRPEGAVRGIDRVFVWRGDTRLFLAVIKLAEDRRNVEHDTRVGQVRVLILVEDSIPFYSSYLPMMFDEIMKQTASLIHEGVNAAQRLLRMRARPKILLAGSFEEAWELYGNFREVVLGVISDVRFPWGGRVEAEAGIALIRRIRENDPYTPLVLQSSDERFAAAARDANATFLHKESPTLLHDFRKFMLDHLGFGDFVFRLPDGTEVGRAADLRAMVDVLETVPSASLRFHGSLNHFSNWLMARTEFGAATALRHRKVDDFRDLEVMRQFLRQTLTLFRQRTRQGRVEDFDPARFDGTSEFVRLGDGSLGGKGRGLAFAHEILSRSGIDSRFPGVRIFVPPSAVLTTDIFDRFLEENGLLEFALREEDDKAIARRFQEARLPVDVVDNLAAFLRSVAYPVAVRSSSLLEDSHYQPFAGVYATRMLPNSDPNPEIRLQQLLDTVKSVYASTFFRDAKAYIASTPNRMEEEKMAVVIQQIVGRRVGDRVYPHASGVASSLNYYPVEPMKPEEGIASMALGLGKTVVEGERAVRFSPSHPQVLPQFSRTEDILDNAQRRFWALDLSKLPDTSDPDSNLVALDLDAAEQDGMLWPVASTYSPESDSVHDGLSRDGVRLVTLAPLLKGQVMPVPEIVALLLDMGYRGLSGPVEVEFAVNVDPADGGAREFAFLQIRPLPVLDTGVAAPLEDVPDDEIFVRASHALGHGRSDTVRDLVIVDRDRFEREKTPEIVVEVERLNRSLIREGRPYVLIGPGRWGSADRWLGIPVAWSQISGARAILECDLADLKVEPSQGTHFFQNMTSYGIGYFNAQASEGGWVDWDWLAAQPSHQETTWLRHVRLDHPVEIRIDGREGRGVILKHSVTPPASAETSS
ncbi:MAG: histidine kinase [Gemmatimonadetes bacterium]|nr:histidine kinase [Gemmatimonadota bacterium]